MRHEASSLSCHRLLGKVPYLVFEEISRHGQKTHRQMPKPPRRKVRAEKIMIAGMAHFNSRRLLRPNSTT